MKPVITYALFALAPVLAACVTDTAGTQTAANASQCFREDQIRTISPQADGTLRLDAGLGRSLTAEVLGECPDLNRVNMYALIPQVGRNRQVCVGDVAAVQPRELGGTTAPYACRVNIKAG